MVMTEILRPVGSLHKRDIGDGGAQRGVVSGANHRGSLVGIDRVCHCQSLSPCITPMVTPALFFPPCSSNDRTLVLTLQIINLVCPGSEWLSRSVWLRFLIVSLSGRRII